MCGTGWEPALPILIIVLLHQAIYWKGNSKLFQKNKQSNLVRAVGEDWSGHKSHSRKDSENSPVSALAPATDSCESYRADFRVFLDHFPDSKWP